MDYLIGIDFGTSTTSIAYMTSKGTLGPALVEINGKKAINSVVRLTEDGTAIALVGSEAWETEEEAPKLTFSEFKMDVGLAKTLRREAFNVTPEQIGVWFLQYLRKKIEYNLGDTPLTDLVKSHSVTTIIGYPAEWPENRKNAIKKLAIEAGFINVEGCNEPTGALFFHAYNGDIDLDEKQNVLVYDFGGGTIDTAVVNIESGRLPFVQACDGLVDFGGRNFDQVIAREVIEPALTDAGATGDRIPRGIRKSKAQDLKIRLSDKVNEGGDTASIYISGTHAQLSRDTFEKIEKNNINRLTVPIESVLTKSRLNVNDINCVIAVGGSTKMYFIRDMLKQRFPDATLLISSSPQEAVAKGLAVFAMQTSPKLRKKLKKVEEHAAPKAVPSVKQARGGEATPNKSPDQSPGVFSWIWDAISDAMEYVYDLLLWRNPNRKK